MKWTQEELGNRCGLSGSFISEIESGAKGVSVDTLRKLCDALAIDAGALLL